MLRKNQLAIRCRLAGLSVLVALLAACSGVGVTSSGTGAAAAAAGSTAATTAAATAPDAPKLTLTGTPATSVAVGAKYSFQPAVSAAGQGTSFTIQGQPTWAEFDAATGALTGTPTTSDEGQSSKVTISAKDAASSASIGPFTIVVTGPANGTATLSWTAPAYDANGSPITGLAGYNIYYGTDPSNLTKSIDVTGASTTTYTVTGLTAGTYYFAVSAYNSAGVDSSLSNIGQKTI
jgi:Fibronectin type III domain